MFVFIVILCLSCLDSGGIADPIILPAPPPSKVHLDHPFLWASTDNEKTVKDAELLLGENHIVYYSYCELFHNILIDRADVNRASDLIHNNLKQYPSLSQLGLSEKEK
jgi:hypothetical protein